MNRLWTVLIGMVIAGMTMGADDCDCCFIRADANGDGSVNLADGITIADYVDGKNPTIHDNLDALDANDDGTINIADSVYVYGMMFNNYTHKAPVTDGQDPTTDSLVPECLDPLGYGELTVENYTGSYEDMTNWEDWPIQSTVQYTSKPYAGYTGGLCWEVRTTASDDYGNELQGSVQVDEEDVINVGQANSECEDLTVTIDWSSEHIILMTDPVGSVGGWCVVEIDASAAVVKIEFTNIDTDETSTVMTYVDFGHCGISGVVYLYELYYTITGWDEDWDNLFPGGYGDESLLQSFPTSGSIEIVAGDLASAFEDWEDCERAIISKITVENISVTHDITLVGDAAYIDNAEFSVYFKDPVLDK